MRVECLGERFTISWYTFDGLQIANQLGDGLVNKELSQFLY